MELLLLFNIISQEYGEGPYILSSPYRQFIKGYEEWREMSQQEKRDHLKSFFNFILY